MIFRSIWFRIALYIVGIYLAFGVVLYIFQDKIIFPRVSENFGECAQMTRLGASLKKIDGLRFFEKVDPHNKATLVVFRGNGGTACDRSWILEGLRDFPINFISVEYPETPSESAILAEAETLLLSLKKSGTNIILFGESLGTAVATYAASKVRVTALILQSPFTSLVDVGQFHYPFYPVRFLSRYPFAATSWAPLVKSPILILRAGMDEVIPPELTDAQIKNFSGTTQVISFPTASHNSMLISDSQLYWHSVRRFIQSFLELTSQ